MTTAVAAMLLVLAACSGGAKDRPTLQPTPTDRIEVAPHEPPVLPDGREGATCQRGDDSEGRQMQLYTCAEGLSCCYPCGVEGCDSICMTPDECAVKRP